MASRRHVLALAAALLLLLALISRRPRGPRLGWARVEREDRQDSDDVLARDHLVGSGDAAAWVLLLVCGPCRPAFVASARERASRPHLLRVASARGCPEVPGVRSAAGGLPRDGSAIVLLVHGGAVALVPGWDDRARHEAGGAGAGELSSHGLQHRDDVVGDAEPYQLWTAEQSGAEGSATGPQPCPDFRLLVGQADTIAAVAGVWFDSPWSSVALGWAAAALGLRLRVCERALAVATAPLVVAAMTATDAATLRAALVSAGRTGLSPVPLHAGAPLAMVLRPGATRARTARVAGPAATA